MTGHDEILAMRRAGSKPAFVWVTDHAKVIPSDHTVRIAPADVPEQLDLRFVVGTTVLVEGESQARVDRIAAVCQRFASRVITATSHGRTVDRITDTQGVMQWPN